MENTDSDNPFKIVPDEGYTFKIINIGRPIFQPVMKEKGKGRKLHPEGDVALLLRATMGNDMLKEGRIESKDLAREIEVIPKLDHLTARYPSFVLNEFRQPVKRKVIHDTKYAFIGTYGGKDFSIVFNQAYDARKPTEDDQFARQIMVINGHEGFIFALASHPRFEDICFVLRTRDISKVKLGEEVIRPEVRLELSRPVFQPYERDNDKSKFGHSAREGDVFVLLESVFADLPKFGSFGWECVSRDDETGHYAKVASRFNRRRDVPVEVNDMKITVTFEEPMTSMESGVIPAIDLAARKVIKIAGDTELLSAISGRLESLKTELDARDIDAAKKRAVESARKPPGAFKVKIGVNQDQGFMKPSWRSAGNPTHQDISPQRRKR